VEQGEEVARRLSGIVDGVRVWVVTLVTKDLEVRVKVTSSKEESRAVAMKMMRNHIPIDRRCEMDRCQEVGDWEAAVALWKEIGPPSVKLRFHVTRVGR